MVILIDAENAYDGIMKFKFVRCDYVKSSCIHARSLSIFCDVTICDSCMQKIMKVRNTANAYPMLPENLLSDVDG